MFKISSYVIRSTQWKKLRRKGRAKEDRFIIMWVEGRKIDRKSDRLTVVDCWWNIDSPSGFCWTVPRLSPLPMSAHALSQRRWRAHDTTHSRARALHYYTCVCLVLQCLLSCWTCNRTCFMLSCWYCCASCYFVYSM